MQNNNSNTTATNLDHSTLLHSLQNNIDQFPHPDEDIFLLTTSTTNTNDSLQIAEDDEDEREQLNDDDDDDSGEKYRQTDVNNIDDKQSLIEIFNRSSSSDEPIVPKMFTNSHDSLLQNDNDLLIPIDVTVASSDDLSILPPQLSSSAFHSKDSALGLSDDNLDQPTTFQPILIVPVQFDENYEQISSLSLPIPSSQSK